MLGEPIPEGPGSAREVSGQVHLDMEPYWQTSGSQPVKVEHQLESVLSVSLRGPEVAPRPGYPEEGALGVQGLTPR